MLTYKQLLTLRSNTIRLFIMKISIGNDHAGPDYKAAIVKHLETKGYIVTNYGTDTLDSVDYPDFVHPVAKDVNDSKVDLGILICGSANGVAMTANKSCQYPVIFHHHLSISD